jgi:hypothetical protein
VEKNFYIEYDFFIFIKKRRYKMDDIYYIIITVIFGLFVLFMVWWLYKYLSTPSVLSMSKDDLTDREKEVIYKFCSEMRRSRLEKETSNKNNKTKNKE